MCGLGYGPRVWRRSYPVGYRTSFCRGARTQIILCANRHRRLFRVREHALCKLYSPKKKVSTADIMQAPITGPESLGLQPTPGYNRAFLHVVGNTETVGNSETSARATTVSYSETSSVANENRSTTSSHLPPHLRARIANNTSSATPSQNADVPRFLQDFYQDMKQSGGSVAEKSKGMAGAAVAGRKLPPHLQGKKKPEQSSEASQSGMNGSTTGSISTATTLRKDQEEIAASRQIKYNAWDARGTQHRVVKNPTVVSSSTSVVSASGKTDQDSNLVGNWDDIPAAPMPQTSGRGKWPKASEVSSIDSWC